MVNVIMTNILSKLSFFMAGIFVIILGGVFKKGFYALVMFSFFLIVGILIRTRRGNEEKTN